MHIAKDPAAPALDCIAEPNEHYDVLTYKAVTGTVLTISRDGETFLRVGHIGTRITISSEPGTDLFKLPDYAQWEQAFKESVAGLPTYKRAAAWEYVRLLQAQIAKLNNDLDELAEYKASQET